MDKTTTITTQIGDCKITFNQTYADSHTEGYTSEEDKVTGFGVFTIPQKYFKKLEDWFGQNWVSIMTIESDELSYGDLQSNNPETFIHWMNYLVNNEKSYTVDIKCEHIFWPVHDALHGLHDVNGTEFYCSPSGELVRFRQAVEVMREQGFELEEGFVQSLADEFNNQKWGCRGTYQRERKKIGIADILEFQDAEDVEIYL